MMSLNQLLVLVQDALVKAEEAYKQKDVESFNKYKKILISTQEKIIEEIEK